MKNFHIKLYPEQYEKLKQVAKEYGISVSDYVRMVINKSLKEKNNT